MHGDLNGPAFHAEPILEGFDRKVRVRPGEPVYTLGLSAMQGPLPAPTASGSFIKTPFPHLMVYALERRLTGTFELSRGAISMATILVMGGCPSKIRTSDPVHFLGNVLLELGMILPGHLQQSLTQMQGLLQGQVLLQMNAIDAARLDAGLRSQVERKVEHLFGLSTDTTFAYYDNVDLLQQYGGPPTPIDPFPVLWRGCREQPALEHVDATYRRVGTALLRAAPNAQLDRFAFTPQEREAVEMLRHRPTRAVDIASALGPRVGQTLVYFLMIMKQVDLIDATQPMSPIGAPSATPSSARMPAAAPVQQQPGQPQQQIARVQLQRQAAPNRGPLVVEEQVAVPSRDDRAAPPSGAPPMGAFGQQSPSSAFGGGQQSAFNPPTPAPQPMRPVQLPPPVQQQASPAPPPVISAPAAPAGPMDIGSMIFATINQSNAPPPVPSPSSPSMPAAAKVPQIDAAAGSGPAVDASPPSGKPLTAEHSALKTKILERADSITSQDYFQMLGVDREASTEQIQKAFFGLAKVWHPDRLPPALVDVKDACSKVFTHLTDAQATLLDAERKAEYMTLLKDGGATPDDQAKIQAILEAATEFQKVEFLLKRNPIDLQAHEMVKRCVELDNEQPDYVATLAWLEAQRPEWMSREKTLEKALILDRCINKNPMCERAYFYRGMLYKRAEEFNKALKDFKKAAELNPRNLDAMREVRLHNMRGGQKGQQAASAATAGRPSAAPASPAATEKLGGLFGKLFKK